VELRGLCGRRAEPPIQTDTSNKTAREERGVLQDREPQKGAFENSQKENKLNEEGGILNENAALTNPKGE
jgi:hypothetical protein